MNDKTEQEKKQAFLDEIKAVQIKHGLQLVYLQPPVQLKIEPISMEVSAGPGVSPDVVFRPWYKRLFTF